jgi:hypothetical protein
MAKIEFSAGMMNGLPGRILGKSYNINGTADYPSKTGLISYNTSYGYEDIVFLDLFSGTKLTKAQIYANRSMTSNSPYGLARTNNRLITFISNRSESGDFSPSVVSNPSSIATIYKPAIKSGTPTWFCLAHGSSSQSVSIGNFIIGDVGITGSGADLEIPDTNILLGEMYRVANLKISFPSFWEY